MTKKQKIKKALDKGLFVLVDDMKNKYSLFSPRQNEHGRYYKTSWYSSESQVLDNPFDIAYRFPDNEDVNWKIIQTCTFQELVKPLSYKIGEKVVWNGHEAEIEEKWFKSSRTEYSIIDEEGQQHYPVTHSELKYPIEQNEKEECSD